MADEFRSMTFLVNDASTAGTIPNISITITENADGTLSFKVIGPADVNLNALYFDVNAVADGQFSNTLSVSQIKADEASLSSTTFLKGDDNISSVGGSSTNMNGLLGSGGGFDAGIYIGSTSDSIQTFSFTLSTSTVGRPLTLDDFANVDFGLRLSSGTSGTAPKLLETTSAALDAKDDSGSVIENDIPLNGNLLSNDLNKLGSTSVTNWSGGSLGQSIELNNAAGTTLTVNADGSWTLDASNADALSNGEILTFTFSYRAESTSADQTSSDWAKFTVTVNGKNDGPDAVDDNAGSINENEVLNASVKGNDTDKDRLDTHTWSLNQGSFDGQGKLVFNADGTWSYDAEGAYDYLNDGESIDLSFTYTMTDNWGASDTAKVFFKINGVGSPDPEPVNPETVYVFNDGIGFPSTKSNELTGFDSNDTIQLSGFGNGSSIVVTVGDYDLGTDAPDTEIAITETSGSWKNPTIETTYGYLVDYSLTDETQIDLTGYKGDITFESLV